MGAPCSRADVSAMGPADGGGRTRFCFCAFREVSIAAGALGGPSTVSGSVCRWWGSGDGVVDRAGIVWVSTASAASEVESPVTLAKRVGTSIVIFARFEGSWCPRAFVASAFLSLLGSCVRDANACAPPDSCLFNVG